MAIVYQNGSAGKICANPECGWKPLIKFAPARSFGLPAGDGYKSRCKDCWNAQKRSERAANPEKHRETARKYVEANKEHIRNLKRKHQAENPEKYDKHFVNTIRHIEKKSTSKPKNVARKSWNITAKLAENHMSVMQKNGANMLSSITNAILNNQLRLAIVVVL